MKILPSLISADLLRLGAVMTELDPCIDGYHLDVMDGHFVPNITWGPAFVNVIRGATTRPIQVHLMVTDPAFWLERMNLHRGDSFIFHHEAVSDYEQQKKLFSDIRARGLRAGIAINPPTPLEAITPILDAIDEVLIMSVNPGFSGQKFIDITDKLATLQILFQSLPSRPLVCVDGGVNQDNIGRLARCGVHVVGAAGAIFFGGNLQENVAGLRRAAA